MPPRRVARRDPYPPEPPVTRSAGHADGPGSHRAAGQSGKCLFLLTLRAYALISLADRLTITDIVSKCYFCKSKK
jgi:hypothetical protein